MGLTRGNVFQSRYLKKEDANPAIRRVIADCRMETISGDNGEEEKAVLIFADGNTKPMVLNATNWDCLEEAYGDNSDLWINKPVEIYMDPGVMNRGKRTGGIRLRIPAGVPVNGGAAPAVSAGLLTWPQAQAAAAAVGISKDDLVATLRTMGCKGYNPERDTARVQEIIASKQVPAEQGFGDGTTPDDNADAMPF